MCSSDLHKIIGFGVVNKTAFLHSRNQACHSNASSRSFKEIKIQKFFQFLFNSIFIKIANCQSCEDFAQDLAKLLAVKVWMMNDNMQKDDGLLSQMQEFAKKAKYLKDHIDEQMALYEKNQGNLQKSYEIFSKIVDRIDGYQAVKDRAQEQISELMTKIKIKDENNSKK